MRQNIDMKANIETLGLSRRTLNALNRCGIVTIEDLVNVSVWRLRSVGKIGRKAAKETTDALNRFISGDPDFKPW